MKREKILPGSLIYCLFSIILFSCQKNESAHSGEEKRSLSLAFPNVKKDNSLRYLSDAVPEDIQEAFRFVADREKVPVSKVALYDNRILLVNSSDMSYPLQEVKEWIAYRKKQIENPSLATDQRMNMHLSNPNGVGPVYCYIPKVNNPRIRISIYVKPDVPADWKTAMDAALAAWHSINGKITFFYDQRLHPKDHYPLACIRIETFNDPATSTIAYAQLPAGGPGKYIAINMSYNWLSPSEKIFTCVHELGHTIGYRHTDQTDGQLITGTPVSDPLSVMNAYVAAWNGFSSWDLFAHNKVYSGYALAANTCEY